MDEITEKIYTGTDGPNRDLPFADWVEFLAEHYERDRKIRTGLRVAPGRAVHRGVRGPAGGRPGRVAPPQPADLGGAGGGGGGG